MGLTDFLKTQLAGIKHHVILWDSVSISIYTAIGKSAGFFIPFFIAAWYGITQKTDAFFFTYSLIMFFSGLLAPVIESILVPYIVEKNQDVSRINQFVGKITAYFNFGMLFVTILLLVFVQPVLRWLTPFDHEMRRLIFLLMIEIIPVLFISINASIISGVLNAHRIYLFPSISPAFRSLSVIILMLLLKSFFEIHAIAIAYSIGEIVRFLILLWVLHRHGLSITNWSLSRDMELASFLKVAAYQIIGMVGVGLNPIVDKAMSSWLPQGNLSVLHYADRLYMIPMTFLTSGLVIALLSHWSERYNRHGMLRLRSDVLAVEKKAVSITLLITLILILFNSFFIHLAYGRSNISADYLEMTQKTWTAYLLGLTPYVLTQIYVRSLLVIRQTKFLMHCAGWMFGLNIVMNAVLMKFLGVAGLALSTSVVSLFTAVFLRMVFFRNQET